MKKFWQKFDDLMDSLPGEIDNAINNIGDGNTVTVNNRGGSYSKSTSTINQNGRKIVVETLNGKLTIKVDGKEYVEKQPLYENKNKNGTNTHFDNKNASDELRTPRMGCYCVKCVGDKGFNRDAIHWRG